MTSNVARPKANIAAAASPGELKAKLNAGVHFLKIRHHGSENAHRGTISRTGL